MCAQGVALYGEAINCFRTDADSTTLSAGFVSSCGNIFALLTTVCSMNNPNNTIVINAFLIAYKAKYCFIIQPEKTGRYPN